MMLLSCILNHLCFFWVVKNSDFLWKWRTGFFLEQMKISMYRHCFKNQSHLCSRPAPLCLLRHISLVSHPELQMRHKAGFMYCNEVQRNSNWLWVRWRLNWLKYTTPNHAFCKVRHLLRILPAVWMRFAFIPLLIQPEYHGLLFPAR